MVEVNILPNITAPKESPTFANMFNPKIEKKVQRLSHFSTYSSTRPIILVLATAIPTANAPTIGDSPTMAAIPDAPKNDAVTIPSMLQLQHLKLI